MAPTVIRWQQQANAMKNPKLSSGRSPCVTGFFFAHTPLCQMPEHKPEHVRSVAHPYQQHQSDKKAAPDNRDCLQYEYGHV